MKNFFAQYFYIFWEQTVYTTDFLFLQNLVLIVVGIGVLFSAAFHLGLKEKQQLSPQHNGVIVNGEVEGLKFIIAYYLILILSV